jgi:hypothetical protein
MGYRDGQRLRSIRSDNPEYNRGYNMAREDAESIKKISRDLEQQTSALSREVQQKTNEMLKQMRDLMIEQDRKDTAELRKSSK